MEDVSKELRGRTRAAILLGFLPVEVSQKIIAVLDTLEKEVLIKEITNMEYYEPDVIENVLYEFLTFIKGNNFGLINSGAEHAMRLLEGSIPEDEIDEMIGRIYSNNTRPLDTMRRIRDVGPLLTFLANEDSQTIAVVASNMKPSMGAELLQSLPPEKMAEVAMAVAKMDQTNRDVLIRIEKHLNKKLENFVTDESNTTDGIKVLVNMLNSVNRHTEKTLFDHLEQRDGKLTKMIKDSMFVFEDIVKLDAMSLQKVINKVTDNELIATALKKTTEEMKEKFYQSMSEGRRRLINDAEEGLRQVRRTDVEEAQQKIANIVKEMEKNKEILIQRGDEDVIL